MATSFHLELSLDRLRETQVQHGVILSDIARRQDHLLHLLRSKPKRDTMTAPLDSPKPKSNPSWRNAAVLAGVSIASAHYLANGGDALTLLRELAKLLVAG